MGRILLGCAAAILVLLVALFIAMPWVLRAAVPEAFARFGIEASVAGGTLNPLRREVTLEQFILGPPDTPALSLGELGVGLELQALFRGRIKLRHLRVRDVSLNAERLLALQKQLDAQSTPGEAGLPVELDELSLEDIRLASVAERIGHDVRIDRLDVRGLSALLAGGKCSVALQGVIGEGGVELKLEVGQDDGKVRAAGTYHLDKVPAKGWSRLAGGDVDPIGGGSVSGRGDLHVDYALDAKKLGVTLDGRVGVTGFDAGFERVRTKDGDAGWQGRLALEWSPAQSSPALRGDGTLDVEKVRIESEDSSKTPIRAAVSDISWHGDFDWRDGFTWKGAVLGTSVDVSDASGGKPAWRVEAQDFSSRLRGQLGGTHGAFDARAEDFDLASLTVAVGEAPVDVTAEKVAFDELRGTRSGDIVLGLASVDSLVVTSGDTVTVRADGLTLKGVSGESSGKLHAAHLDAASLDIELAKQRLRVEEVVLASVGFSVPTWVGAGELHVKSLRAEHGGNDVWVSALRATRLHGDGGGSFGAESVDVEHMFQSGSADLSWEATRLKLRGLDGDIDDAGKVASVDLHGLKVGLHDASWEAAGLHASELAAATNGTLSAAGIDFAKLERRQPGTGDLRVSELGAHVLRMSLGSGLRMGDSHGALEGLKAGRLQFDTPAGSAFDVHGMEAWNVGGDLSRGLDAERFSAARGSGRLAGGGRLDARAFSAGKLKISAEGAIAAGDAKLGTFSHGATGTGAIELKGTAVADLHWRPAGPLSSAGATVKTARYTGAGGDRWDLAGFDSGALDWDGGDRVKVARASLDSASQSRGEALDWQAQGLQATGFQLGLPGGIDVATLKAERLRGGSGTPDWSVDGIDVRGFTRSAGHEQDIAALSSGAVAVTDAGNRAELSLDGVALRAVKLGSPRELSAGSLRVVGLRLRSSDADWPSRLTVAELRAASPALGLDGVLDLGEVEARTPYLIVGETRDNTWMLPPLPGTDDEGGRADKERATGGVRVARFRTSGPGRVAFIDRATEPAIHLVADPLVVAIQNLDTSIPGNVARFRARGTGSRFSEAKIQGELRTAVHGFDLSLIVDVKGADLAVVNPYVALREPFAITAGRGDAHNNINIKNEELSGEVKLLLSGLKLEGTRGGPVFERLDPANFPLRTALTLLRDQEGNISLDIPLKADTGKAEYDFVDNLQNDFVDTVTAAGQVAANLPGRTLSGAVEFFERTISILPGVDAWNYLPIPFAPGDDALSARPFIYLDQLASRMLKHEALVLALCGRAVTRDSERVVATSAGIDALFAEAATGVYPAFAPDRKGLLALAGSRSDRVRRYMHEIHRIPESRLPACDPEFDDTPDAKPRVDLAVKTPANNRGFLGILP